MIRFKNTEEALQYGETIKHNQEKIEDLRQNRKFLLDRITELRKQGREGDALFLASGQYQFSREALEQATGQHIIE